MGLKQSSTTRLGMVYTCLYHLLFGHNFEPRKIDDRSAEVGRKVSTAASTFIPWQIFDKLRAKLGSFLVGGFNRLEKGLSHILWKQKNETATIFPTIFGLCACSVEGSDAPQTLSTCLAPLAQVETHCWVLHCNRQRSEDLRTVNTWPCKLTHQPHIHCPQCHRIPRKRNSW